MHRVRAQVVRIVDHGDATMVIGPRGALRFEGDSAALLRAVLEIHGTPVTRGELFAELAERSAGDVPEQPVDELVAILERERVIVAARPPAAKSSAAPRRVVLGISGAVAAVDAPALVRGLQAMGCEVRIALTKTAQRFVSVAALEALTHHAVWRGIWQRDERVPVPHINLAEWAELVVVWPASATTLSRIASGDCSDLVSALVTATRAPVVIAPSMNDGMYGSPAVQDNLEKLRAHGRWLVHPTLGIEVAHRPDDRRPMFGPAAPPAAVLDIVRHLLVELVPRPRMPQGAPGWERLWSTTPLDQLPWHADALDEPLAIALDARAGEHKRLLDLGTGAGLVAIAAAQRGFHVTATDIAPSALGKARERAGELPILFVLDDVTSSRLAGPFDVAVDCGLLHCLPRESWPAYAAAVTQLIAPHGSLLLVAHQPGAELATTPVTPDDLAALLPEFRMVSSSPSMLSHGEARLFELERR
jgi:SAM-dependent methyltransferase